MKSRLTKAFRRHFDRLPGEVQQQALRVYRLWHQDPYHSSLQFKRVSLRQPVYSVRVGSGYRALGLIEDEVIYWFWLGPHSEYDHLLKRL